MKIYGPNGWCNSSPELLQLRDQGLLFSAPGGLDDQFMLDAADRKGRSSRLSNLLTLSSLLAHLSACACAYSVVGSRADRVRQVHLYSATTGILTTQSTMPSGLRTTGSLTCMSLNSSLNEARLIV